MTDTRDIRPTDYRPDPTWYEFFVAQAAESDPALPIKAIWDACLPVELGGAGVVTPDMYQDDSWYWLWNMAGISYLRRQKNAFAADVYLNGYLCALALQLHYAERSHKGLALGNLGISRLRTHVDADGLFAMLLSLMEDAITYPKPTEYPAYRNLRTVGARVEVLTRLVAHAQANTRGFRIPLFPETWLLSFLSPSFPGATAPKQLSNIASATTMTTYWEQTAALKAVHRAWAAVMATPENILSKKADL